MLHHTRGIILHYIRFSETSVIAKIYTEKFGLQSYLIKGVRSPKSKIRLSLLGHLNLLEMVVYYRDGKSLQSIKELRPAHVFQSLHNDIRKSSQTLFINEVIYKSVKEEESNPALFDFLYRTVIELDDPDFFSTWFHHRFMLDFSGFLGFSPRKNFSPGAWFNLREGLFEPNRPPHENFISPDHSSYFNDLISVSDKLTNDQFFLPGIRKMLLSKLIEYYGLHVPGFGNLHSPDVLHEVLSG